MLIFINLLLTYFSLVFNFWFHVNPSLCYYEERIISNPYFSVYSQQVNLNDEMDMRSPNSSFCLAFRIEA